MADNLYLSLWFPNFRFDDLGARLACVLRQITPSSELPGIRAAAVYPLSWSDAHVYQRLYDPEEFSQGDDEQVTAQTDAAVREALELSHEDYAYEFEVYTDLWTAPATEADHWTEQPELIRIVGFGPRFDDSAFESNGHIRIEFGNDAPFLYEQQTHVPEAMMRVQQNVARLLDLTARIEKACNPASRLLWSESEDDLAQKLLRQLQKLN